MVKSIVVRPLAMVSISSCEAANRSPASGHGKSNRSAHSSQIKTANCWLIVVAWSHIISGFTDFVFCRFLVLGLGGLGQQQFFLLLQQFLLSKIETNTAEYSLVVVVNVIVAAIVVRALSSLAHCVTMSSSSSNRYEAGCPQGASRVAGSAQGDAERIREIEEEIKKLQDELIAVRFERSSIQQHLKDLQEERGRSQKETIAVGWPSWAEFQQLTEEEQEQSNAAAASGQGQGIMWPAAFEICNCGRTQMLPFVLFRHDRADILEDFYRCQECLKPVRRAASGQGHWQAFGCKGKRKGKGKGFEVKEFEGVVREFKALLTINGEVKAGHGTVQLASGESFLFNEEHCVGAAIPSKGDQAIVRLQRVPEMMPTLLDVRYGIL